MGEIDNSQSISASFWGKDRKICKNGHLTQSKPLFWPNLPLWVIFSRIGMKRFEKVGKLKKFADVPPLLEMEIFEISPKMICFGGKRWKSCESGEIDNSKSISASFVENIEKYVKMAVLTQSKPLFWPNLPLWVIFSRIGVKRFEKVGKLKNMPMYPLPRNENF